VSAKKWERNEIANEQGWLSPLTGRSLLNKRLDTHHDVELWEGGLNVRANKVVLPIAEHIAVHLKRALDHNRNRETRKREWDTVTGRCRELTKIEMIEMKKVAYELTGKRIEVTRGGVHFVNVNVKIGS
jgi:hypothetical protein